MMQRYRKHIAQCCYTCKDYIQMKNFYNRILELEQVRSVNFTPEIIDYFREKGFVCNHLSGEEAMSFFAVADNEYIVLMNVQYGTDNRTEDQGFYHMCLMTEDIIQMAGELEKKGIQLWEGPSYESQPYHRPFTGDIPQPCHSLVFFIKDPEGNEIEIMQFTKESLQVSHDFE